MKLQCRFNIFSIIVNTGAIIQRISAVYNDIYNGVTENGAFLLSVESITLCVSPAASSVFPVPGLPDGDGLLLEDGGEGELCRRHLASPMPVAS